MKLLGKIHRAEGLNLSGKAYYREAVRGIIPKDGQLLMILSTTKGDYKFPGGGIDPGETPEAALEREVQEETGALSVQVLAAFGYVIEYDDAFKPGFDFFEMKSSYFLCRVGEAFTSQKLDPYEHDLGFRPAWVTIDDAIAANRTAMQRHTRRAIAWAERETFVLELLRSALR